MRPSEPAVIPRALLIAAGRAKWVMFVPVVVRPIVFVAVSVNQTAPSEPVVMLVGWLPFLAAKPEMAPVLVTRPILFVAWSTNQTLPSFPIVMSPGWFPGLLMVNVVILCVAAPAGPAAATAATASNPIPASARPARRRCDMCALPLEYSLEPRNVHSGPPVQGYGSHGPRQPPCNQPLTPARPRPEARC